MARSGPWTPDWNARTRRRGTQATLNTIWPGSFVWLPWPYDERVLRSQAVNEVSEGRFNHPFVVLAVDERSEKATILMVTTLSHRGLDIEDDCQQGKLNSYLPIYPSPTSDKQCNMQLRFNNSVPGDTHRWINVFNPSRIHYSFLEHDVFSGPRSLTQESFIDLITYMVDFGYLLSAERYLTWDNMRDLLRFVREGRERLIASTYLSDSADRAAREITPPHNPPATEADHAIALRKYGYPLPTETLLDYFRPPPQLRPMIRSSTQTPGWPSVSSIAQWGGRMLAETPTMVRNVFRTAGGTTTSLPQSLYHDWTPRKSSSLLSSLGTPLQPGNAHSLPPPNVNYSPLDHHEVQAFVRKEVDAMKNTYEAKLQMLERTHANEFENLKSEHARQLAEEKYQTEKDRRDAHADRERERQHQKNQHEHEVQALTRMHKLTVVDMKAEKERLERKYRELGEECENTEEVLAWQERDISLMLRESDDDFKFYKELIEQGKLRNADLITQEKLRHSVEMRKVHQGYKARIAESQGLAGKLFVAFLFVLLLLAAVLAEYIRM